MLAIVTVTPLQLLIARGIVSLALPKEFVLANFNAHDSAVLRRQFKLLAEKSVNSEFLILNGSGIRNFLKVTALIRYWKTIKITELLVASIDNIFIQYVVKSFRDVVIRTFDDGSVNIVSSSIYYQRQPLPWRQRLIYSLLRGNCDQDWIKTKLVLHYSIFKGQENIVDQTRIEYVPLLIDSILPKIQVKKKCARVWIGFSDTKHEQYIRAVLAVSPDYYLPHPMEKVDHRVQNTVATDLLAEEFLGELLCNFDGIKVYACTSTALLNIQSPRIQRYVVDLHSGCSIWQLHYNKLASSLGCEILDVDSIFTCDSIDYSSELKCCDN